LLKDVASDYVQMVGNPVQLRHTVDRAMRIAKARRTVTAIVIPHDVQLEPAVEEPPRERSHLHSSVGFRDPVVVPDTSDIEQAAAVLNGSSRPALLVGAGALNAGEQVIRVAETLGAGVAKALLGK